MLCAGTTPATTIVGAATIGAAPAVATDAPLPCVAAKRFAGEAAAKKAKRQARAAREAEEVEAYATELGLKGGAGGLEAALVARQAARAQGMDGLLASLCPVISESPTGGWRLGWCLLLASAHYERSHRTLQQTVAHTVGCVCKRASVRASVLVWCVCYLCVQRHAHTCVPECFVCARTARPHCPRSP